MLCLTNCFVKVVLIIFVGLFKREVLYDIVEINNEFRTLFVEFACCGKCSTVRC